MTPTQEMDIWMLDKDITLARKVFRVLRSCRTMEQLHHGIRYARLAKGRCLTATGAESITGMVIAGEQALARRGQKAQQLMEGKEGP